MDHEWKNIGEDKYTLVQYQCIKCKLFKRRHCNSLSCKDEYYILLPFKTCG